MNLIRMIRKNPEKPIFHGLKIVFEKRLAEEICSPIHVGLIQSLSPISRNYWWKYGNCPYRCRVTMVTIIVAPIIKIFLDPHKLHKVEGLEILSLSVIKNLWII